MIAGVTGMEMPMQFFFSHPKLRLSLPFRFIAKYVTAQLREAYVYY